MMLWVKARICQEFPAYRLGDLEDCADLPDLLRAMQLLALAREATEAKRGG